MEKKEGLTPRQLIIFDLMESEGPKQLNHIAVDTGLQPQLVDYHLRNMVITGLVITVTNNGKKYYMLQPVFYDETLFEGLAEALLPVVDAFSSEFDFSQIKISPENALIESFMALLEVFVLKIKRNFEKSI